MSKKSLILVIIQFSCFAFFAIDGIFKAKGILLILQLIAFFLAIWGILVMRIGNFNVQPEVKVSAKIVTKGPYKIIRNPMYTGIIFFIGIAIIVDFTMLRLLLFLVLTAVLILKIYMEEKFLTNHFGEVYVSYKEKTFRLIPYLY